MGRLSGYFFDQRTKQENLVKRFNDTCPFCGLKLSNWAQIDSITRIIDTKRQFHDPDYCFANDFYFSPIIQKKVLPIFQIHLKHLEYLNIDYNKNSHNFRIFYRYKSASIRSEGYTLIGRDLFLKHFSHFFSDWNLERFREENQLQEIAKKCFPPRYSIEKELLTNGYCLHPTREILKWIMIDITKGDSLVKFNLFLDEVYACCFEKLSQLSTETDKKLEASIL